MSHGLGRCKVDSLLLGGWQGLFYSTLFNLILDPMSTCPSNCHHNTTTPLHCVLIPIYLSVKLSSQYDHTHFPCLNPQSTCPSNFQHITATHLHRVLIPIYLSIKLSAHYGNTPSPCLDPNLHVHQTVNTMRQHTFTLS